MPNRSPVIFWLLLAATIWVDVAAGYWIHENQSVEAATGLFALTFGQLSTLCIWIVFSARATATRWLSAGAAILLAAVATQLITADMEIPSALAIYASHVTIVTITLWLLRAASTRRASFASAQFSIMNLLILMTVVALVAALLGNAQILHQQWTFTFLLLFGNAIIATVCVAAWRMGWHGILRISAALAAAILTGWITSFFRNDLSGQLEVMNCLQVVIVFTWLQWGGILSETHVAAAESPTDSVGLEPTE